MNNMTHTYAIIIDKYGNNSCSKSEIEEFLNNLKRADNEPEVKKLLSETWGQISDSEKSVESHSLQKRDLWFEEIYSEGQARC